MRKPLLILALSLAANAAFLVTYFVRQRARESAPPPDLSRAAVRPRESADTSGTGLSAADVQVLKRSQELIAGGDLPTLVARLRAAGFPPSIVRAIISAQLTQHYAAKKKAAVAHQEVVPYWKSSQSFPYDPKAGAEITNLTREQAARLKELLGPDADATDDWSRLLQERRYGSLSQDKIDRLQSVTNDYNDLRSQLYGETRGILLPEDQAKLELLEKEQRADIAALLSPAELEEYELRTGGVASRLRSQLGAFSPTEEEFRTIFRLSQAYEAEHGRGSANVLGNGNDPRAAAQNSLRAQIIAALGAERGEYYDQAARVEYVQLAQVLDRFDLPESAAPQIISVGQDIQQRAAKITQDRALANADRAQQLAALSQEAQTRLTSIMGDRAYDAYKRSGGWWLNNLTRFPVNGVQPAIRFAQPLK